MTLPPAAEPAPKTPPKHLAVWRECLCLVTLALALRLGWALYASGRFPPADDGDFYHAVARRIAQGNGYTWAWPDGAVTHAAHYPVGYPALLGAVYALFDARPLLAMLVNAVLGALLVLGVHVCALTITTRAGARWAALSVALHPTLVLYTAALMTEAPSAAVLMLLSAWAVHLGRATRPRWASWLLGVGGAFLVLLRPQLLPLLLVLGAVSVPIAPGTRARVELLARARGAVQAFAITVALCLPWTLRNCSKMDGCVFVSANGGWNLLIGTLPEGKGSFAPIAESRVPIECREVYGEAAKDRCFGGAGARRIAAAPFAWLALVPLKLGRLFNHSAVAAPYLHASNPSLVTERLKFGLGAMETVCSRLLLLCACLGVVRSSMRRWARGSAVVALFAGLSPWGYLAQIGLFGALAAGRPRSKQEPLLALALSVLGLTLLIHAVFFGAPRYALIWLPWLSLLAVLPGRAPALTDPAGKSARSGPATTLLTAVATTGDNFRSPEEPHGCR